MAPTGQQMGATRGPHSARELISSFDLKGIICVFGRSRVVVNKVHKFENGCHNVRK